MSGAASGAAGVSAAGGMLCPGAIGRGISLGLFGLSSGASLAAVQKKLPELAPGARVLTFCYDTGERYLSIEGLFPASA